MKTETIDDPALCLPTAIALFKQSNLAAAEEVCRWVPESSPDFMAAALLRAEIALQLNRLDAAIDIARAALMQAPKNLGALFVLGRGFQLKQDFVAAREAYEAAVAEDPGFAPAWQNLMDVALALENHAAAASAGRLALRLGVKSIEVYLGVGRALLSIRRAEAAEEHLRCALVMEPDSVEILNTLARAVQQQGRSEEAIALLDRAAAIDPSCQASWFGSGVAYRGLGRFAQAIASFQRCLDLNPDNSEARCELALCQRAKVSDAGLEQEAKLLRDEGKPVQRRITAGFSLGKNLDDLGLYDDAYAAYATGNRLAKQLADEEGHVFSLTELRQTVDFLIATFTTSFVEENTNNAESTDLPIFVLGHYRAGTSLTEQIIASHPEAHGAGELHHMLILNTLVLKRLREEGGLHRRALAIEAKRHLARLVRKSCGRSRVVDKHPDNIFALGTILLAFPRARVVICHRDIRDNVLSCFFQRFVKTMSFSNDLGDCAVRHIEVERLAAHWRRTFSKQILDLQYETLITDFATESRRLIDHVGLPWHPACEQFYETERTVNTPSAWGVRQPIYTSSCGRWRNYARYLDPVVEVGRKGGAVWPIFTS